MADVPSNLIPTRITQLPVAPVASEDSLMMIIYNGVTYQIRVGDLLNVSGVPTSRQVNSGTGLTGGGDLSANRTISIATGGVGTTQLASTGVTPGEYGDGSNIPVFTVDATGRVINASTIPVSVVGYVPDSRQVIAGDGLNGGGSLGSDVTLSTDFSDATPEVRSGLGSAGVSTTSSRADHVHPAVNFSDDNQVQGVVTLNNGGTGRSLVPDNGAIIWCGADGLYVGPVGTAGQVVQSTGVGEYIWVDQSTLNVGQADNLNGGDANRIAYQTADGVTGFIGAPTTADTFLRWDGSALEWGALPGGGTVTSVGLALPSEFDITVSPITASGTLTAEWTDQVANTVLAGPATGADATPAFRALVNDDLPLSGVTADTYGSATAIPVFTVDDKGIITNVTTAAIVGGLLYQGSWNANTNTPTLTSGTGVNGNYYVVSVAGTTNLDGITDWQVGDWAIFNGTIWQKIDQTNLVSSVNGQVGAVSLSYSDVGAEQSGVCVKKAGDTMTGMLNLAASTSSLVPLHLAQGTTPSSPVDGDVWFDQNGIYIKNISAIHQMDADANSTGPLSKATITDNGDGTIDVSSIEVFIYAEAGWQGNYMRRTVPAATNLSLVSGANYLTVIYNSGVPIYQITQNASSVNNSNVLLIANMWLDGTQIHYVVVNWGLATANRLNDRLINVQRYVRTSGLMLGESATPAAQTITATSGLVWYGVTAVSEPAVDSSSSNCDFYYHVAGVWTKSSVSVYNNTQYDNGTNLVTLSGAGTQYAVNWVYRYVDGSALPKLAYVLGSGNYNLAQAQASTAPTPPPILTAQAILVGRIIVAQGATTATQIDSAFTSVFAGSTVTEHNNLANIQGGTADEYYHLTSSEYIGTGSGDFVRATSPTLTTPVLGTPTSGNFSTGTFTWPTFNQNTTGTAGSVAFTLTRGAYLTGSNFNGSAATTWDVDADSANTASKVVVRDASGNFAAGQITATKFVGIDGGTF